jgi:hypothetical protein
VISTCSAAPTLVPPAAVTVTETVLAPLGAVTVISVEDRTFTWVASLPPKWTDSTPMKLRPRMVTLLPPRAAPWLGESEVIAGAATH